MALSGYRTHFRASRPYRRSITRRAWRRASPPAPNHAQTSGRSISNQGSVPAPTDTPMTISWRRFHREQRALQPLCNPDQEERFRAALALEPSHRPRGVPAPWNPDQPFADWMSASVLSLNPDYCNVNADNFADCRFSSWPYVYPKATLHA